MPQLSIPLLLAATRELDEANDSTLIFLAIIELTRRLRQAYEQAYDQQAADRLLPQNTDKAIASAVDRPRTILVCEKPL